MNRIYLLWHTHKLPDGSEDSKLVSVHLLEVDAKQGAVRARELPGFRDHPDGFEIHPYDIGRNYWPQGFPYVPA